MYRLLYILLYKYSVMGTLIFLILDIFPIVTILLLISYPRYGIQLLRCPLGHPCKTNSNIIKKNLDMGYSFHAARGAIHVKHFFEYYIKKLRYGIQLSCCPWGHSCKTNSNIIKNLDMGNSFRAARGAIHVNHIFEFYEKPRYGKQLSRCLWGHPCKTFLRIL